MIATLAVLSTVFYIITRNSIIENRKENLTYSVQTAVEYTELELNKLHQERLYQSEYFRTRVYRQVVRQNLYDGYGRILIIESGGRIHSYDPETARIERTNSGFSKSAASIAESGEVRVLDLIMGNVAAAYLVCARDFGAQDGYIVILNPLSEIQKQVTSSFTTVIPFLAIILTAAVILVLRFSNSITEPLTIITGGLEKIGAGDLHLRLGSRAFIPEFRKLIESFNRSAGNLEAEMEKRIAYEQMLKSSLDEKDVLLKEVHHRVKNNMAIISSLLSLQSGTAGSEQCGSMFFTAINRINAMALVHEKIYRTDELVCIDLESYLEDLVPNLLQTVDASRIDWLLAMEKLPVSLDQIVPLGLIFNELVTNTIKHGLNPDGDTLIRIETAVAGRAVEIVYSDGGSGPPADSVQSSGECLGLQLVDNLAAQLGGAYLIEERGGKNVQLLRFESEYL